MSFVKVSASFFIDTGRDTQEIRSQVCSKIRQIARMLNCTHTGSVGMGDPYTKMFFQIPDCKILIFKKLLFKPIDVRIVRYIDANQNSQLYNFCCCLNNEYELEEINYSIPIKLNAY